MRARRLLPALALALLAPLAAARQAEESAAQENAAPAPATGFEGATASLGSQLEERLAELSALRELIAEEKIPLSRRLNELEAELSAARAEFQATTRTLDSRSLDLSNLQGDIARQREEARYLSGLFSEYARNFESRLHVAELQRFEDPLEAARLAPENDELDELEVFEVQAGLLQTALARLEEALGGMRFEGTAVDPDGVVRDGTFLVVGPAALFRTADGALVGAAEQRLGSLEPTLTPFPDPLDQAAAAELVASGAGSMPLDPTLGDARKVEATKETFLEHVQKGGVVMVPIFVLAGLALLVALWKWIGLTFVRKPSKRRIRALLDAVARNDEEAAREAARHIRGPTGAMLRAGVEHLGQPRELIEEVMFERMLETRLRVHRALPFVQICAAAAPLLGLLGTVTGIISTFKQITVFGTGDPRTLSGGISIALITTEFGLIVAIPSLLLHAFLSRKANAVVNRMEQSAVAFLNEVGRSRPQGGYGDERIVAAQPDPELVRAQVREALTDILAPAARERVRGAGHEPARDPTREPGRERAASYPL